MDSTATRFQVAGVIVERFQNRDWFAGISTLATHELARFRLRRPEVEDSLAIGVLTVIGNRKPLRPSSAPTIGTFHEPRTRALVAPVAELNSGRYADEEGLATNRQAQSCGSGFQGGRAEAASHSVLPVSR
jgi:hypothetical protein